MVRYRRAFVPGGTFFFTVALEDRRTRTLVEHVDILRAAFRTAREERPFTIEAIVVLPEHLHTIWTLPEHDADFSGRWRRVKSLFTRQVAKRSARFRPGRRGEYRLWQRRFWEHAVRDEGDFERHLDYIHFNPVKHGLTSQVRDWPFSSFHRYVRRGWLPDDWGGGPDPEASDYGEP